jgi:hypothetical protein
MIGPGQDEEIKYRFSRPLRIWSGVIAFVTAIAGTITLVVLREWDGLLGMLIAVYGIGDLLAEQLGLGTRLARKIRHATLLWVLVSVAILVLAAMQGVSPIVIAVVAAMLLAWDVFSFRYHRGTRQGQQPNG